MKIKSIAYLSTDSDSFLFIKGYIHRFMEKVEGFQTEEDLLQSSHSYCVYLLEEFLPSVKSGELLIKIKELNPNAKIFFFSELALQLKNISSESEDTEDSPGSLSGFSYELLSLFQMNKSHSPFQNLFDSNGKKISLSPRELEITKLLLSCNTIKQTAEKIGLSYNTVNTYVKRIYKKLEVKSRTGLYKKIYKGSNI